MIDTHVHFWDIQLNIHSWVNNNTRAELNRSFTLGDYLQLYDIPEAIVTIEAADNAYTLIEVEWIKQYIMNNAYGIKIKHMAYIDILQHSEHFIEKLKTFSPYPFVCGFRHILAPLPDDMGVNHSLITQLKKNLITLKENNYIFDCQANPEQLLQIADAIFASGVCCIVDHAGLPNGELKNSEQLWLDMLQYYVGTHVFFKITENSPEIVSVLLEKLSADQLLLGSNFPVSIQPFSDLPKELMAYSTINAKKLFNF